MYRAYEVLNVLHINTFKMYFAFQDILVFSFFLSELLQRLQIKGHIDYHIDIDRLFMLYLFLDQICFHIIFSVRFSIFEFQNSHRSVCVQHCSD